MTSDRAQEERATKFNEASEARDEKLAEIVADSELRTKAVVEAAEEAMEKATSAAGAFGLVGSSERYKDEADQQKKGANLWRLITVCVVVLAVGAGIWAAAARENETSALVGRLAIGLALGALAAYTARQSGRHRDREEDTREIALDLAAFNSFIEPLSEPKDKDEERRALGKRIFGQQLAARNRQDHPAPVGQKSGRTGGSPIVFLRFLVCLTLPSPPWRVWRDHQARRSELRGRPGVSGPASVPCPSRRPRSAWLTPRCARN